MSAKASLDERALEAALLDIGETVVDKILAEFVETVSREMPVEDGHAHEALASAASLLPGPKTHQAASSVTNRSGDPQAASRATASYTRSPQTIEVFLACLLPFMRKIEYGFIIRVGDLAKNKGPKVGGRSTEGELYAPRKKGKGGRLSGTGSGFSADKRQRKPPKSGFWAKGKRAIKLMARQLGLRVR